MKFKIDHDYHIHSKLSLCSNDEQQTAENILHYAEKNCYNEICITDHFWDENVVPVCPCDFYQKQHFNHISQILPLPQSDTVKFYFGCEVDMDKNMTVGISDKMMDIFDFVIIPTTHLHFTGFTIGDTELSNERRAYHYIERIYAILNMDLPFEKIGFAHATCPLLAPGDWENHLKVLDLISDKEYKEAFEGLAKKGAGFELNFTPSKYTESDLVRVLRPYNLAKEVGCKFYLGSDAHHPSGLETAVSRAETIIELLKLEEKDKFSLKK